MPADLRLHIRYPEDFFNTQMQMFATYHMQDPEVFYHKGDQWQIPDNVELSGPNNQMAAYYVIMRLPEANKEEFLLMLPFVPNGRSNMISWLGARCDPPNYGKAVNFQFSKSTTVYGPSQVEAAVNRIRPSRRSARCGGSRDRRSSWAICWSCPSRMRCCTCSRSTYSQRRRSCRSSNR